MIEVLKQALEALEDVGVLTDREWQAVHKNKANELRQAILGLESQEQVSYSGNGTAGRENMTAPTGFFFQMPKESQEQNFCPRCGKRTNDIHTCTPPQRTEQEPVAWKHDCAALLQNNIELWVDGCPHCGKPRTVHSPQRKPLTDEIVGLLKEARKIIRSSSSRNLVKDWDERTTKAIAAHGIKE